MTEDDYLDDLGVREGLLYEEPPKIDQPTAPYGVTLDTLEADRGRPCTVDELKALSPADARELCRRKLRRDLVRYGFDKIADEHLRVQLLDFGHNSGEERAIRWLQRAIGMRRELVTGKLDARTLTLLSTTPVLVVNNALVAARLRMIDDATDAGTVSKRFEEGLESRALSFGLF